MLLYRNASQNIICHLNLQHIYFYVQDFPRLQDSLHLNLDKTKGLTDYPAKSFNGREETFSGY